MVVSVVRLAYLASQIGLENIDSNSPLRPFDRLVDEEDVVSLALV